MRVIPSFSRSSGRRRSARERVVCTMLDHGGPVPMALSLFIACSNDPEPVESPSCADRTGIVFDGEIEGDALPDPIEPVVVSGHAQVGREVRVGAGGLWMLTPSFEEGTSWFRFGEGEPWYVAAEVTTTIQHGYEQLPYTYTGLRRLRSCEEATPVDATATYCLDPSNGFCQHGLRWTQDGIARAFEVDRGIWPAGWFDGGGGLLIRNEPDEATFKGMVLFPEQGGLAVYCIQGSVVKTTGPDSNTGQWEIEQVARVGLESEGAPVDGRSF